MTYLDYLQEVNKVCNEHPSWRYGQVLFNVLERVRPELASRVRGSEIDPYFVTGSDPAYADRMLAFYEFLWDNWE